MGVETPRWPDAPKAICATWDWVSPVLSDTPLVIWSKRLRFSPICSKLLDVVPPLLRDDGYLAKPLVNVSANTAERSVLAEMASLRAVSTCLLASVTS